MCYDENLNNLESLPFPHTIFDLIALENNLLLATNSVGYDKTNYQLYQYNTQNNNLTSYLSYKAQNYRVIPIQKDRQFAKQGNSIQFIYAYCNLIYDINIDCIKPIYKFSFSERYKDKPSTYNDIIKESKIIRGLSCIKQTPNSIILEYIDRQRTKYSIFNKVTQKCTSYQNTMKASAFGDLLINNYLIQDNFLIAYYSPVYLQNAAIFDLNKVEETNVKKRFQNVIARLNEYDNPIIIKFKLKPDSNF